MLAGGTVMAARHVHGVHRQGGLSPTVAASPSRRGDAPVGARESASCGGSGWQTPRGTAPVLAVVRGSAVNQDGAKQG